MKFLMLFAGILIATCNLGIQAQTERSDDSDDQDLIATQDTRGTATQWDCFVYPVPAIDEINVKVTKGQAVIHQVRITDDAGNDVYKSEDMAHEKIKIDISTLSNGKYYLVLFPEDDLPVVMKRFYVSK